MTGQMDKFLPRPTPESAPFWQGCRDHKLLLQYCTACGTHQFYPRVICANCMSEQLEWREASGRGTVETYTIVTRAVSDAYAAHDEQCHRLRRRKRQMRPRRRSHFRAMVG